MHVGVFLRQKTAVFVVLLFVFFAFLSFASAFAQQPDTTPPELVDFDFIPKAIDTRYGPQDVEITIHARDDLTGVQWGSARFESPSGEQGMSR